jgi:hypothetical protein
VIDAPWSQLASECPRFGHPPPPNNVPCAQEPTASAVVEGGGVGVLEQLLYAGGNSDTVVEGALHCMRNLARSSGAAARALVAAHGGEGLSFACI